MATSEYSYYSMDEHHEQKNQHLAVAKTKQIDDESNASARIVQSKSGMTEKNVVPDTLPDFKDMILDEGGDDQDDNLDAASNWTEQVNEANEKSGFTTAAKGKKKDSQGNEQHNPVQGS